ncbi:hypothetical protein CDG81_12970 [Actinopolyspora erythraea]|uniref:DUF397 domain-containing protein n=1 Tax=Actinopolyspora erythraea TaxID=414996 RepID=A0A099D727_9ACTN|nr:hypothetical protein CDG81_12970 [Actinopolyspora erythraea]KGI81175.1 hypothetical protein IL38_13075 [Actinopolyspora erythraea]
MAERAHQGTHRPGSRCSSAEVPVISREVTSPVSWRMTVVFARAPIILAVPVSPFEATCGNRDFGKGDQ